MKISSKVRYGLRTMIELTMNAGSKGMLQKEIAKCQEIPIKYLDQIIADLKSAGLIVNINGKRSGYILAKSPFEVSVYDIFRAFEAELSIVHDLQKENRNEDQGFYAEREYWNQLNKQIIESMSSKTLDILAATQMENETKRKNLIYFEI